MPKTAKKTPAKPAKKEKKVKKSAAKTAKPEPVVKVKKTPSASALAVAKTALTKEIQKAAQSVKMPASKPVKPKTRNYFYANGKRKTSVASVRLISEGKGAVVINNRPFENYFPVLTDQDKVVSPLKLTGNLKIFDVSVKVNGGGVHSQAEAVRHGISKALLLFNGEYRSVLKPLGYLTRDSRVKERKKYGLKRARRAPQWQKR